MSSIVTGHGDHFWGNQIFTPNVDIISTGKTRTDLLKKDTNKEAMQRAIENEIQNMETKLAEEQDANKRRSQANEIATRREILAAIPTFVNTIPNLTFEQQLTIYGSKKTIELLTYGGGHTASDAFLYLPDDQILFMGDLLFVHAHPWIGHGNPEEWVQILQRVEQLSFTTAVPGHGSVGTREDMVLLRDYLTSIVALAEEYKDKSLSLDEAMKTKIPAPFDSWEGAEVFDWNMEFLYSREK